MQNDQHVHTTENDAVKCTWAGPIKASVKHHAPGSKTMTQWYTIRMYIIVITADQVPVLLIFVANVLLPCKIPYAIYCDAFNLIQ